MLRMTPRELKVYEYTINHIEELRSYIEEYRDKNIYIELDDQYKKSLYFSFSGVIIPIYSKLLSLYYENFYWSKFDKYGLGCNVLLKKTKEIMSMTNDLMETVVTIEGDHEASYFYHYVFELIYNANEGEKIEILKRLTFENNIWLIHKIGEPLKDLTFPAKCSKSL